MSPPLDLLVVGAGPAGLSLAAEAGERGLVAAILDPAPDAPWPANYGLWADEAEPLGVPLAQRWSGPTIHTDAGQQSIARTYAQVDAGALQRQLRERCAATGVVMRQGHATEVAHDSSGSSVTTDSGQQRARLVADCSGHRPALMPRATAAAAFQTAFGLRARVRGHPWAADEMALMDYRQAPIGRPDGPATFLYAMPLAPDRVFVEETVLVASPALAFAELERRLHLRLAALGVELVEIEAEERCRIAMDAPRPALGERLLGLGAAAGMVHPATGYSLASSLRTAPRLAETLAASLGRGDDPATAVAAGWEQVWPAEKRALWSVLDFGRDAVLGLDADSCASFFATFFQTPDDTWRPFLDGRTTPRGAAKLMWEMFLRAPSSLRLELTRAGFGRSGLSALQAILG